MKTLCFVLALFLVAVTCSVTFATETGSLYCDGRIVSVGDTAGAVVSKCGQPAYAIQREERISDEDYYSGARLITTVVVDDWTFNFGPDRFQYRLILKNGAVWRIESLDYGY